MFTIPGAYHMDSPPSMAAVYPWFHTSLLKPAGPRPIEPLALENDSYEVEALFQVNKRRTHDKVELLGYDSSQNLLIWLFEL